MLFVEVLGLISIWPCQHKYHNVLRFLFYLQRQPFLTTTCEGTISTTNAYASSRRKWLPLSTGQSRHNDFQKYDASKSVLKKDGMACAELPGTTNSGVDNYIYFMLSDSL